MNGRVYMRMCVSVQMRVQERVLMLALCMHDHAFVNIFPRVHMKSRACMCACMGRLFFNVMHLVICSRESVCVQVEMNGRVCVFTHGIVPVPMPVYEN